MRVGDVVAIQEADFAAELCPETPAVTLRGSADIGRANVLQLWLSQVHESLVVAGVAKVEVDLRRLEFMSASAFNSLVGWLGAIHELPEAQRYKLHLRSNPEFVWQRRSLQTLACFATDLITVEAA